MKFLKIIVVFGAILLLASCRMPVDKETLEKNLIADFEITGAQEQFNLSPSEVKFKAVLKNTYGLEYVVKWYLNDEEVAVGQNFSFTPQKAINDVYQVYYIVTFIIGDDVITRQTKTAKIITKDLEGLLSLKFLKTSANQIDYDLMKESQSVGLEANFETTFGKLTDQNLIWHEIKYHDDGSFTETILNDLKDKYRFELTPTAEGLYGYFVSFEDNSFVSNTIYLNVFSGKVSLIVKDDQLKVDYLAELNKKITNIKFFYQAKGNKLTVLQAEKNPVYVIDPLTTYNGIVYAEVTFDDGKVLTTDKRLFANHFVSVKTEAELLEVLANKEPIILIENDLLYTETKTLEINYPTTIVGRVLNGIYPKIISEKGINNIITINADHVYLKDLEITDSNKYNVLVKNANDVIIDHVILNNCGKSGNMNEPSAGLFILDSEVAIFDLTINNATNGGIRIEGFNQVSKLFVDAKHYKYDKSPIFPIVSAKTPLENNQIIGRGFSLFKIPFGGDTILYRWSSDGAPVHWSLKTPTKIDYFNGEYLDFTGIMISVSLMDEQFPDLGLEVVYLLMDKLKAKGKLTITDSTGNKVVQEAIITGYDEKLIGDKLTYTYDDKENAPFEINLAKGKYRIYITIGDDNTSLELGFVTINVR